MNFGHDFGYYFRLLATTFGLIFNIIVYLPFAYLAFKTYYRVKETVKADNFQEKHTKGFFWIGIMAVCYVLSNLELFIEGIIVGFFNIPAESMYMITGIFSGIFTVIGYISAYLGYIKPGKTEN
ncbi:MAG: hypothetical protein GY870_09825 [archaeon]|nr:hypothetical protein [archaeon]